MKPIVTDTYDFPTLIREGYLYVDKTVYLRRMVSGIDGRFFFMSRPRRFGKSLMISTLEQIFLGNKKLFRGLAIEKSDYDWKKYPVIRLDMSMVRGTSLAEYRQSLCAMMTDAAKRHGVEIKSSNSAGMMLHSLISVLNAGGSGIAVLIDEYDAPLGGLLSEPKKLESVRQMLHDFYVLFKVHVADIRFLMMTGVSKFSKLSVFSGLNNLTDLSASPEYSALLGYTVEELKNCFAPQIAAFAKCRGVDEKQLVAELLAWYDSYRFSPDSEVKVCNPVSVGRALKEKKFAGYWNATGNASLIVERLRAAKALPDEIEGSRLSPSALDKCDIKSLPLLPLLYQGGYLTIKNVDSSGCLILGIPNREVRIALYEGVADDILKGSSDAFTSAATDLKGILDSDGDGVALDKVLTSVFAMVPHEWKLKNEAEAKRYFLLFMRMAGADICVEEQSVKGRADAVLKTEKAIYIFEFKYGKTAKAALKQIKDRNYAAPYAANTRKIVCVGVNYNSKRMSVEVVNEPVNFCSEPVNEPVNLALLEAIREHPGERRPFLMTKVRTSEATMKRSLARLIAANRIEFRGAPKTGGYYLKENVNG